MGAKGLGGVPQTARAPSAMENKVTRLAEGGAGQHLGEIERQLSTPITEAAGVLMQIPVSSIFPDPQNPRRLNFTLAELRDPPRDVKDRERLGVIDAIQGLANSMVKIGQQEPIKVYERGSK